MLINYNQNLLALKSAENSKNLPYIWRNEMIIYLASLRNDKSGVTKKVMSQIDSFSRRDKVVYFVEDEGNLVLNAMSEGKIISSNICSHLSKSKLIRNLTYWKKIKLHLDRIELDENESNLVYYRMTPSNPSLTDVIKYFKKKNCSIVKEIPTYPYIQEYIKRGFTGKIKLVINNIFKGKENTYIDWISTFSDDKEIDGHETIILNNSIPKELSRMTFPEGEKIIKNENDIRFLIVTSVEYWQGIDRIIRGIHEFNLSNGEINVTLKVIGTGKEIGNLREIVSGLKLEKNVEFSGFLGGQELDNEFKSADIAFGQLGLHRKEMSQVSSLKTKEYLARHIPFVYSGEERFMDECNYALQVPANDEPVDIPFILNYYIHKMNNVKINSEFDNVVNKYFTWDVQIDKVLETVNYGK